MTEAAIIPGTVSKTPPGPISHRLAGGDDWSLSEFICDAGPDDRPFEEQHDSVSLAFVLSGSFNYASDTGKALMHPGALLLGNHGACYQCNHRHSTGDRCLSVRFSAQRFEEVAATAAGSSRFRFPVPMLGASQQFLHQGVVLEAASHNHDRLLSEEKLIGFLATVIRKLSGQVHGALRVSALDERRISRTLRYMEGHASQALDLDQLAAVAALSKFHFLRVFRRTVGQTPYQYLLQLRLRRAALRLLSSRETVSAIAFDQGFGDLSTFNQTFRAAFGMSPRMFRRNASSV
jgi:AraC family transcriptional regulator